jgi:hypothetical protein
MGSASIFCDKAQIEHWFKKATARFFAILERTCAALSGKAGGSDQCGGGDTSREREERTER